ncbi:hypothetical protein H6F89_00035 [Cyanobacteria bacterium FACHB-63]|nr:hypothetical protein [Cyanobacteria bacterium FACHB-63]
MNNPEFQISDEALQDILSRELSPELREQIVESAKRLKAALGGDLEAIIQFECSLAIQPE